jgi:hypothetical protein
MESASTISSGDENSRGKPEIGRDWMEKAGESGEIWNVVIVETAMSHAGVKSLPP